MKTFRARYGGECPCGRRFHPDEVVGYIDGELCCSSCVDDQHADEQAESVCPECRLQHRGECF